MIDRTLLHHGRPTASGGTLWRVSPDLLAGRSPARIAAHTVAVKPSQGVVVNGERIEEETLLNDRDVIRIGHSTPVYTTDDTLSAIQVHATWKQFGQGHINTMMPD